jgi:hypothetical protein
MGEYIVRKAVCKIRTLRTNVPSLHTRRSFAHAVQLPSRTRRIQWGHCSLGENAAQNGTSDFRDGLLNAG